MEINRSSKLPVYKQIYSILIKEIKNEVYKKTNILPGEHILSKRFKVGRATVRKALQILDNDGYIKKIPGFGTKIIDSPTDVSDIDTEAADFIVPADMTTASRNILFLTQSNYQSSNNEYFHYELIHIFEKKLSEKRYNLIIKSITEENNDLLKIINETAPAGIIFDSFMNEQYYLDALKTKIPCVSVNHYTPLMTSVVNNNFDAAYNVIKMLSEAGHKKIAVITGKKNYQTNIERFSGVQRFYMQNDLKLEDKCILHGDWTFESGFDAGNYIMSMDKHTRPSAVFAFNDDMALGLYNFLVKSNISVPEEISIVGFDKSNRYNSIFSQITTVDVNIQSIVSYACWYLLGNISGIAPETFVKIQIETNLVVGNTVKLKI